MDGPPGQLRHGPHCGPAQLNGWANRSIWAKVRMRCQEAVFSTGAWLPRVMAAESGHGWPASHVPCVAERRSLLLALKIDEIEGNAADELSSATVPIPPNGVACVYEPGGKGQSTALVTGEDGEDGRPRLRAQHEAVRFACDRIHRLSSLVTMGSTTRERVAEVCLRTLTLTLTSTLLLNECMVIRDDYGSPPPHYLSLSLGESPSALGVHGGFPSTKEPAE